MPLNLTIGQTVPASGACPPPPPGLSCLDPLFVQVCNPRDFEHACAFDAAGNKLRDVTLKYEDTGTVVCDFGTSVPYTGPAYSYIGECVSTKDVEHACAFDAAGNKIADVDINYGFNPPAVYNFGTTTPYSGAPYAYLGVCVEPPAAVLRVLTDGVTVAGAARQTTPEFAGATDTIDIPAVNPLVQSFTVTAFDTIPGLAGNTADQVIVYMPSEKLTLNPGETRSWSVVRDQDGSLNVNSPTVFALGNAYAHVSWTFV